jgi:hypothetical protein
MRADSPIRTLYYKVSVGLGWTLKPGMSTIAGLIGGPGMEDHENVRPRKWERWAIRPPFRNRGGVRMGKTEAGSYD